MCNTYSETGQLSRYSDGLRDGGPGYDFRQWQEILAKSVTLNHI
jgi:hypothetical protein